MGYRSQHTGTEGPLRNKAAQKQSAVNGWLRAVTEPLCTRESRDCVRIREQLTRSTVRGPAQRLQETLLAPPIQFPIARQRVAGGSLVPLRKPAEQG